MYYGVIGKPMEISITDILKVGQLVLSRKYGDMELFSDDKHGRRGLIVEIRSISSPPGHWPRTPDEQLNSDGTGLADASGHIVKVMWQDTGETEQMPDWFAAELLEPMPS